MPEGPEVEIVRRKLERELLGKQLISIQLQCSALIDAKNRYNLIKPYFPATVTKVMRKAKYLYIELKLNNDKIIYLHSHLKMTGRWVWEYNPHNRTRVILCFGKKNGIVNICDFKVYFEDSRKMGAFDIMTLEEVNNKLNSLAPDIFNEPLDYDTFWKRMYSKGIGKRCICPALMDQELAVSGIGNYLKSEILFAARVDPKKCINELDDNQRKALHFYVYDIAKRSLDSNGLTIKDFLDPDGNRGVFERLVYDKTSVDVDGVTYPVITGNFSENRTTYYCSQLQY